MNWQGVLQEKIQIAGRPVRVCRPETPADRAMVFYHGWSSDAEKNMFRAAILAAHGYLVLVPEAVHHGERGTLSYEDPIVVAGHMFAVIDQNAEEFSDLLDWLRTQGIRRVAVTGHSMGGFTAAAVFSRYREPDVCVNMNGSFSFQNAAEGMIEKAHPEQRARIREALVPWQTDPQNRIESLAHRPILMINGGADDVIDAHWHSDFYERLAEINGETVTAERIVVDHLGHFVTTNMLEELLRFADKHMGDTP